LKALPKPEKIHRRMANGWSMEASPARRKIIWPDRAAPEYPDVDASTKYWITPFALDRAGI
jgi:hypothetical protein